MQTIALPHLSGEASVPEQAFASEPTDSQWAELVAEATREANPAPSPRPVNTGPARRPRYIHD